MSKSLYLFLFLVIAGVILIGFISYLNTTLETTEGLINPNSLPKFVFKDQPTATNEWFSSAYNFPTQPLFAMPGAYRISTEGLEISLPQVVATPKTVFGSFVADCLVSLAKPIEELRILSYGDWHLVLEAKTVAETAQIVMTQGSPQIYILGLNSININCADVQPDQQSKAVVFTKADQTYIFQAQDQILSSVESNNFTKISSEIGLFRISLAGKDNQNLINSLIDSPWAVPTETQVNFDIASDEIHTTYTFSTHNRQPVLTTIWPHQKPNIEQNYPSLGSYPTVYGQLDLVSTNSIITKLPVPKLPFTFQKVQDQDQIESILESLEFDAQKYLNQTPPEGVYFKGTWLGAISSLIQLADLYQAYEIRDQLLDLLESHLIASLSTEFRYDPDLKMLIADKPEFGNEFGNDHHFHYGYYIRSAAILAQLRPELQQQLKPTIELMIADIASLESSKFPRLRSFSTYAGHSFADGRANFADGNNQESTSEALNAWYAIKIWADVVEDKNLVNLGSFLFANELASTTAYWFGFNNPFPDEYDYLMASIIWGGKRDYATWFSGQDLHIYGIQWLPITPASSYLKSLPNPNAQIEFLESLDGIYAHEWADLFVAYQAIATEKDLSNKLNLVSNATGAKSQALVKQIVFQQAP